VFLSDLDRMNWCGNKVRLPVSIVASTLFFALSCVSSRSFAGGGPENVFLVVNPHSYASVTIANHFCRLRHIPPSNVMYLNWTEDVYEVSVGDLRNKLLTPILNQIKARGLTNQIDYIVYSSDFPYRVNLTEDLGEKAHHALGSLTSLTYLAPLVLAKRKEYASLNVNWYYRKPGMQSHGFRVRYAWDKNGNIAQEGQRYMLSTMLGFTSGRGNSVPEVTDYLARSAMADGFKPRGTIYYMENSDVRTRTRRGSFAEAVAELKRLGVRAEILQGDLPSGRKDVQGLMAGIAAFQWKRSGSRIRPGAICEHLTSYGGILTSFFKAQTPISEFLRYGAAGSGGTVVEPFAIQNKFPHPNIHVHYARGCSLAEAFYQSVWGPYQLLILGDPLCQPWADIPFVDVEGAQGGDTVRGTISLTPQARVGGSTKISQFQLFVDGRLAGAQPPGETFDLDTTKLNDGYHDLRIVAVVDSNIETQGRKLLPLFVNNLGRTITCRCEPAGKVAWDQPLTIHADSPGSRAIAIYHNRRVVGQIPAAVGQVRINPKLLGTGPVTLLPVGVGEGDRSLHVFGEPLQIEVAGGPSLPPGPELVGSQLTDGLMVENAQGERKVAPDTARANWLTQAGVRNSETVSASGYFRVPVEGMYQFVVQCAGNVDVTVDGLSCFSGTTSFDRREYIPVMLQPGWHRLNIRLAVEQDRRMILEFGGEGTTGITGRRFKTRK